MAVKSIKDIARLSGYSISTVSRVLNNTGRISQTTRGKILKIAKENNYTQNIIAKGMREGSLCIIGILVPDITNPYYASIVKKCEQLFFQQGYLTIVCNTERNPALEKQYIAKLANHIVDGLIIISAQRKFNQEIFNIPVAFIDRSPKLSSNMLTASSDNYAGAVLATNHLIDRNCYPVMITTKSNEFSSNKKRIQGFSDSAKNRNITKPNIYILKTTSDKMGEEKENIISYIKELLNYHQKLGVFAINDNVASNLYQMLQETHIKVPEQVSIVGFDDSPIAQKMGLSTIHQNTSKIAEVSCANLIKLLKDDEIFEHAFSIPVSLIRRHTT